MASAPGLMQKAMGRVYTLSLSGPKTAMGLRHASLKSRLDIGVVNGKMCGHCYSAET